MMGTSNGVARCVICFCAQTRLGRYSITSVRVLVVATPSSQPGLAGALVFLRTQAVRRHLFRFFVMSVPDQRLP